MLSPCPAIRNSASRPEFKTRRAASRKQPNPELSGGRSGGSDHWDFGLSERGTVGARRDAGTDHADAVGWKPKHVLQSEGQVRARDNETPKPAPADPDASVQDREVIDRLEVGYAARHRPAPAPGSSISS